MPSLQIRPLVSFDELVAGVELQKETWGREFDDVVSAALMRVTQKIGGISAGAFDAREGLVGIVFGLTGILDDARVHWSHMLAVKPDWRGKGLGTVLKVYQRHRMMPLDVHRMYWTFDPLEARNAHFNLVRLGVKIERYVPDMYGSGETSTLHRGIGTDRLVALWPLRDHHVRKRVDGIERLVSWDDGGIQATIDLNAPISAFEQKADANLIKQAAGGAPSSGAGPQTSNRPYFVEIPPDIQRLKVIRPHEASSWRKTTRAAFTHYLSEGASVIGFIRDPQSGRCFYVLDHGPSD